MAAYFFVLLGGGWSYGQSLAANDPLYLRATTACLSAIIVMQIVNVFLCRSSVRSVFSTGLFGNRLIVWGVVLEIVLALLINYTSVGNWLLDTAPVPGELWLLLIASGAGMLALEELRKWIARKIRNDHLVRSTNQCQAVCSWARKNTGDNQERLGRVHMPPPKKFWMTRAALDNVAHFTWCVGKSGAHLHAGHRRARGSRRSPLMVSIGSGPSPFAIS